MDLIAHLGPQLDSLWEGLALAVLGDNDVAWAAPDVDAPIWFDVAREFSEFWIHQQQIRDAVGRAGAQDNELVGAVVDTLIRGLPLALSGHSTAGSRLCVQVTGPVERTWVATRGIEHWQLERAQGPCECTATVQMTPDTLWRLASRGITPEQAARRASVTGDLALGRGALHLLAIIRSP